MNTCTEYNERYSGVLGIEDSSVTVNMKKGRKKRNWFGRRLKLYEGSDIAKEMAKELAKDVGNPLDLLPVRNIFLYIHSVKS